jgi:hypothetical protein
MKELRYVLRELEAPWLNRMMSVQCWRRARGEGEPLRVIDQRHESLLAVAVVAHEDRELALGREDGLAVLDEPLVALQEGIERRARREIARVVGVALHPPVRRVQPDEVEHAEAGEGLRVAGVLARADVR